MSYFSVHDPIQIENPATFYARAAELDPVFYDEEENCFILTRHVDVKALICDYELFDPRLGSLQRNDIDEGPLSFDPIFLQSPPEHTRVRRLSASGFSLAAAARFEQTAREIANDLVSRLPTDSSSFDLMADYCEPLAVHAITRFLEVAEEGRQEIATTLFEMMRYEDSDPAAGEIHSRQLAKLIAHHMGQARDNAYGGFPGALLDAEIDGDQLSAGEVFGMLMLGTIGGAEDMAKGLANVLIAVRESNEALNAIIAEPERAVQAAILEGLRLMPTTQYVKRVVRRPINLHGVAISPGASIIGLIGPANRDESVFPEAGIMRLDRRNISASLTFGSGAHACIGKHIGKAIIGAGIFALKDTLARLEIDPAQSKRTLKRPILGFAKLSVRAPAYLNETS